MKASEARRQLVSADQLAKPLLREIYDCIRGYAPKQQFIRVEFTAKPSGTGVIGISPTDPRAYPALIAQLEKDGYDVSSYDGPFKTFTIDWSKDVNETD